MVIILRYDHLVIKYLPPRQFLLQLGVLTILPLMILWYDNERVNSKEQRNLQDRFLVYDDVKDLFLYDL